MTETVSPKMVRITRSSNGVRVGYWLLRPMPSGGWRLTKRYTRPAGDTDEDVETGIGYEMGAVRLLAKLQDERDRIVKTFTDVEAMLVADAEAERLGTKVPPRGFRPGWAARRLAQWRTAAAKNAQTWPVELENVCRTLSLHGWIPPDTTIDSLRKSQ